MAPSPGGPPPLRTFSEDWANTGEWEDHTPAKHSPLEEPDLVALDELSEAMGPPPRKQYAQGSTIGDYRLYWLHEQAIDRGLKEYVRALPAAPRLLVSLKDVFQLLFIVTTTGIGVGVTGAILDILVHWLNDLRQGRCGNGFMYNEISCCSGLDPGELCTQWRTWSQWFGIISIAGQSFLQALAYILLAIAYSAAAAILVKSYAPYAFHTGIPEIKSILNGYVLDAFLGPWTLLIKALGLALAVASGLSLGKEGPMVHVSCCMAALSAGLFPSFGKNELRKRLVLSAAAAAGVSVAFGSPLGGILFGLEELDLFSNEHLIWTAFVTSSPYNIMDPFGTGKLVLFEISAGGTSWRAFELVPWLAIGAIGGVLGSLFIRLNIKVAVHRQKSVLGDWPVVEVIIVSAGTAIISFVVANLFKDCVSNVDYLGLCNGNAVWSITLLVMTAGLKFLLTVWTFGMKVPAGVFLPSLAIGASLGRAIGLLIQAWHRTNPTAWVFTSCPPEGDCISPGFYAVIGAAAMLGGVTRMTSSYPILTGALSHVLPIMIAVMVSKWVGDSLSVGGIYVAWIGLHDYPFLPNSEFRDKGETAADLMRPVMELETINGRKTTLSVLESHVRASIHKGFPVIVDDMLLGYITRESLTRAIEPLLTSPTLDGETVDGDSVVCTFLPKQANGIDLSSSLERTSMRLRQETPLEVVVRIFQSLNIPYVLFTSHGKLAGIMTRRDVMRLMSTGFEFIGVLDDPELERSRT
ncbi:hypothetical protein BS47DRAFT_1373732 [Hydnum rufescens UP504]|uniref:CBS domain-containing protein n=1 Tax=Hydnum rufescens UP504 TaxID=1448309 RepID=A0A9P6DMP2_9AGAM|nr:hypothetical protein BS47DRAFT_1373732 [Hydnum rufescens UP504]